MESKKPVLVRVPLTTLNELLIWSAEVTVARQKVISIPALMVEIVEKRLTERAKERIDSEKRKSQI